MSIKSSGVQAIPEETMRVARAAFPQGNVSLTQATRVWVGREEGKQPYQPRAGVEGTRSQGVRGFGLRGARYEGLKNTHC